MNTSFRSEDELKMISMRPTSAGQSTTLPKAGARLCRPAHSPRSSSSVSNPPAPQLQCSARPAAAAGQAGGVGAAAQQQQQQLPPYYQLSLPVYSLATVGPDGGSPTMNLVTYASPISLKPRQYALGLYLNTLSWENMLATRTGLLQVGAVTLQWQSSRGQGAWPAAAQQQQAATAAEARSLPPGQRPTACPPCPAPCTSLPPRCLISAAGPGRAACGAV